ncbi:hypothetical protein DI005_07145 [Prauserella sp. PE36]|uniref:hypothetical protein n=1 Tax=Prauserella sp. PE36 TaxID=1504709 RepID=UPI000D8CB162|nr:hypothetical protein [Prauserella sp. PE36]PXY25830.1 hypothetical protein BAY59_19840 [Prauserella coralliicola]RBM22273.1 hypothetical protein DI005_07145 [Prauserella sp. PE36]
MITPKLLGSMAGLVQRTTLSWKRVAVAVLVLLATGFTVAGGVLASRTNSLAALDESRTQARQAAKAAVADVLSYDHRSLDADRREAAALVTGSFADDFDALMDDVLGSVVRDKRASVTTTVTSASVMEGDQDAVVVLVLLAQESEQAGQETPVITSAAARVEMRDVDGRWLIAELAPL